MAKLTLVAAPTFKSKVGIPVAGAEPVEVEFTFKHRTKSALDEFVKQMPDAMTAEVFMDMVVGWELDDDFNKESVDLLLENYMGAGREVCHAYIDQLIRLKAKN